jgi:diguanylate cyclase (GGDEF)-like protein/PAS domain S-box-containing protein
MISPSTDRFASTGHLNKLLQAIESNPVIILVTDAAGLIQHVNAKFCEITGFAQEEILGQPLRQLGEQTPEEEQSMWEKLRAGVEWHGAFRSRRKQAEPFLEEATIFPIKNPGGFITHFVKVAEDVTYRRKTEETVRFLAYYDPLTELPNRRLFSDRLGQGLARNQRTGEVLAVLSLDIDNFKSVNNSYGHRVGDEALKIVSERIASRIRTSDTVAHFSGDCFNILLPKINQGENAAKVALELLDAVALPIPIGAQQLFLTASIGIALFPMDGEDVMTLMKNADLALHRAKDLGRNSYQMFTATMNQRAVERMALETDLRLGLESNAFELHFQPQLDGRSGALVACEALVRWQHPTRGLIAPGEFIPMAEETGMILRLGSWVLQQACRQVRAFQQAGLAGLRVAVNLSARQFLQHDLPGMVAKALEESALEPECLEIEITEGTIIEDFARAHATLSELRALGVSIAIDDFGTGYSALSYLQKFPVDVLKIDRSFICDLHRGNSSIAITQAIVTMAHELKLQVLAEGVDSGEQLEILATMDCDLLQGFYLSRPLTATEFLAYAHRLPVGLPSAPACNGPEYCPTETSAL